MRKYSYEFKLKVVNEYLNGSDGFTALSKRYDITSSTILKGWVNNYRQFGTEGLQRKMSKAKYSGEFKLSVLKYRQDNQLSYRETANHFKINRGSTIANWQRAYDEEGFVGLDNTFRRPKNMSENKPKKLKESEVEELKRLREENEFLRMSLEYQKKLNALVLKRDQKTKKRQ